MLSEVGTPYELLHSILFLFVILTHFVIESIRSRMFYVLITRGFTCTTFIICDLFGIINFVLLIDQILWFSFIGGAELRPKILFWCGTHKQQLCHLGTVQFIKVLLNILTSGSIYAIINVFCTSMSSSPKHPTDALVYFRDQLLKK